MRSPVLCMEPSHLWEWCNEHHILLSAAYVPGTQNVIAESLSRNFATDHELELHDMMIADIFDHWGIPSLIIGVDLFTSHTNTKQGRLGAHSVGDTLVIDGSDWTNYAPPTPIQTPHPPQTLSGENDDHSDHSVLALSVLVLPSSACQNHLHSCYRHFRNC